MSPGGFFFTIVITSKGQRISHRRHPVQAGALASTDFFFQPCGSRLSKCSGQAATHQPQPVQRWGSMVGSALGVVVVMGCGGAGSVPLERAPHKARATVPP